LNSHAVIEFPSLLAPEISTSRQPAKRINLLTLAAMMSEAVISQLDAVAGRCRSLRMPPKSCSPSTPTGTVRGGSATTSMDCRGLGTSAHHHADRTIHSLPTSSGASGTCGASIRGRYLERTLRAGQSSPREHKGLERTTDRIGRAVTSVFAFPHLSHPLPHLCHCESSLIP